MLLIDNSAKYVHNMDSEAHIMRRRLAQVISGVLTLLFLSPRLSLAYQEWQQEGLYIHQAAHLLFLAAMVYFIYEMRRERLQNWRGFRLLIWACALLALWNVDSMVGHFSEWFLENPVILGGGLSRRLLMDSPNAWIFYITKLDHFILLAPAFYLLYRGLKSFTQEKGPG
jgi:hypothetical protein